MQTNILLKKGAVVGIILLFIETVIITSGSQNIVMRSSPMSSGNILDAEEESDDVTPPHVVIKYPIKGGININRDDDHYLFIPWPNILTIIIGSYKVNASAYDDESGINRVGFWVDGILKYTDNKAPYSWIWSEKGIFQHILQVVAYDNAGNHNEAIITLWKIQLL